MSSATRPQRTPRALQKEQTADRILAAARDLFAQKGFEETTTREIALHAGVAAGTVFVHFPDKNVLLAQCLRENIGQVLDVTKATLPDGSLTDRLVHMSRGLVEFYAANAPLARELIKHATFQLGEEANAFNRQTRAFVDDCTTLIREAAEQGEMPTDVDATGIARCYLAFHFFVVNGCLRDPQPTPGPWLAQLRDMVATLLDGYRRGSRRPA